MTQTTGWFPRKSVIVSGLIALIAMAAPGAHAAFSDNFDALRAELQDRSDALAESLDKTEQKQKKAADKIIAAIDKESTSLATDVKTAGKVAKSVIKAFPDEFALLTLAFENDISTLLDELFDGLQSDVAAQLDSLETTVNALAEGSAKDKALASVDAAHTALDAADNAPDLATRGKALASALKAIASGLKAANSGGGGGGCSSSTVTMTVSNEGPVWNSTTAVASYTPSTGDFTVGGTRGESPNPFDALAIGLTGVTGEGDYTLGETSVGGTTDYFAQALTVNAVSYALTGGTIHIATFHAGAEGIPNGSTSGTFHFNAEDIDHNTITIDGSFSICTMVTLPPPVP